jgi:hypothetical protein
MLYLVRLHIGYCCIFITLAFGLAGCSMHPLPEDVSRASTFDIVERIRCEVQEGLRYFQRDDRHANRIIGATTIGYDFNFLITENNGIGKTEADPNGGNLTLRRPSFKDESKGFTLDMDAGAHKTRVNTRRFRIIEELKDVYAGDCSQATTRANWVYPITGATGMGEVVRTYVKIEKLSDLRVPLNSPTPESAIVPNVVFSDVLKFTTTLSGGVKGTLVLNAVAGSLKVTNAALGGSASRVDEHTVIVALASDPKVDVDRDASGRLITRAMGMSPKMRAARIERKALIDSDVLRDPRTVTALIQKDATARNRVLIELQRLRGLEDDEKEAPRLLGERLLELLRVP